jgi:hypothetical protein
VDISAEASLRLGNRLHCVAQSLLILTDSTRNYEANCTSLPEHYMNKGRSLSLMAVTSVMLSSPLGS